MVKIPRIPQINGKVGVRRRRRIGEASYRLPRPSKMTKNTIRRGKQQNKSNPKSKN